MSTLRTSIVPGGDSSNLQKQRFIALNAEPSKRRVLVARSRVLRVVADEVRTLATRTHSSTKENTSAVIVSITQGRDEKTVASMEESRKSGYASVEEARNSWIVVKAELKAHGRDT